MEIKALSAVPFDALFTAFKNAFLEYERSWTAAEFKSMLQRRGFNADLSFGAFDGPALVSFTLNGIGYFKGVKTAYDTGTGTLQAYRGKGLATAVFKESIPFLEQEGIQQYLLEVLSHNKPAISIYEGIGFTTTRMFRYAIQDKAAVKAFDKMLPDGFTIQEVTLGLQDKMALFFDFNPAWQNSFEAIRRSLPGFKILGAFLNGAFIGYGIIECATGDIPQIAIATDYRRHGFGSAIFSELLAYNKSATVRLINTEYDCNSMNGFLTALNILDNGQQLEMLYSL